MFEDAEPGQNPEFEDFSDEPNWNFTGIVNRIEVLDKSAQWGADIIGYLDDGREVMIQRFNDPHELARGTHMTDYNIRVHCEGKSKKRSEDIDLYIEKHEDGSITLDVMPDEWRDTPASLSSEVPDVQQSVLEFAETALKMAMLEEERGLREMSEEGGGRVSAIEEQENLVGHLKRIQKILSSLIEKNQR